MPSRCTCGAVLPEDARFCHKCGKPQYEEDIARAEAQQAPTAFAVPSPKPAGPKVSFGDARALGISLAMACLAFVCFCAVGIVAPPLAPLVFCGAGFVAALIYNGRSAQPMSVRSGAQLGWMTGLWVFVILVILSALMSIYIADPNIREQAKTLPNIARMPEAVRLLDNPHQLMINLVVTLVMSFFLATFLAGIGGMLGAKFQNRSHSA